MSTLNLNNMVCVESVKLLGDYWMLRIISALEDKPLRFSEIQRSTNGISPATLTNRLKKLESALLIERKETNRADVTYALTPLGQDAIPFLAAINTFAIKAEAARAPRP